MPKGLVFLAAATSVIVFLFALAIGVERRDLGLDQVIEAERFGAETTPEPSRSEASNSSVGETVPPTEAVVELG